MQRPGDVAGQARSHVGEHHGGDLVETGHAVTMATRGPLRRRRSWCPHGVRLTAPTPATTARCAVRRARRARRTVDRGAGMIMADGVGHLAPGRGGGRSGDQRRRPGPRRHALARGPTPGPGRPAVRRARGRWWWPTTGPPTGAAVGRSWAERHDGRPVDRRLGHRRGRGGPQRRGAGGRAVSCWPSATPTTSCSPAGWRHVPRRSTEPTWSPGSSTSGRSTAVRPRPSSRPPPSSWASSPPASAPTWPCAVTPSRRSAGSPRSC